MLGSENRIALNVQVFWMAAALCLMPQVPSAVALALGLTLALTLGNPYRSRTQSWTPRLLGLSVMGLGAGMNLLQVAEVGWHGLHYTAASIALTFALGIFLGRSLGTTRETSILLGAGTAICGGSAIAAIAPVIRAKDRDISVALGVVFLLNAFALVVFPMVGHAFSLTERQFGLWAALAIHDTSSVVGATLTYGTTALAVGTSVKLARALWIVPLTVVFGMVQARWQAGDKANRVVAKKPWFIAGFLLMAALVTFVPPLAPAGHAIEFLARRGLVVTLFLIGANLSPETLRSVGFRPLIHGVLLWVSVAGVTLIAVRRGMIS